MSIKIILTDCEKEINKEDFKIFPKIQDCNDSVLTLDFPDFYFQKIIEFNNWYNELTPARRKAVKDNHILSGEKNSGSNQKFINSFVKEYIKDLRKKEFIFKFCEIANDFGFQPLTFISTLPIAELMKNTQEEEFKKIVKNSISEDSFSDNFEAESELWKERRESKKQNMF